MPHHSHWSSLPVYPSVSRWCVLFVFWLMKRLLCCIESIAVYLFSISAKQFSHIIFDVIPEQSSICLKIFFFFNCFFPISKREKSAVSFFFADVYKWPWILNFFVFLFSSSSLSWRDISFCFISWHRLCLDVLVLPLFHFMCFTFRFIRFKQHAILPARLLSLVFRA